MGRETKLFTFDEVVELLQASQMKTKEEAEKEFALWLAKTRRYVSIPDEVAQKIFNDKIEKESPHLLQKANFEALKILD